MKHITQKDLSDKIGISRERISKVEQGHKGLSPEVMMQLADYFDVPLEFLYFGKLRDVKMKQQLLHISEELSLLAGVKSLNEQNR